jgi:peptide/nickel transport system ATP-binding protein
VPDPLSPSAGPAPTAAPLLDLRRITKTFGSGTLDKRRTVALEDFSLTIAADRPTITAIAGESGSGKTTLARLALGMITPTSGTVRYRGTDVANLKGSARMTFRREVQAIFQDPYEVYNPFYNVDYVFNTVIDKFGLARGKDAARALTESALEVVGLRPGEVLGRFPHQLSGGQRQRVMVARAFMLRPRLIVADEPVSMVDASLRAMILDLMLRLRSEHGIAFLYVTHDLSTAYQICDDIYILYRGRVAERGDIREVIPGPRHPYTQLLIGSIPDPDPDVRWGARISLPVDEEFGGAATSGCLYAPRCPYVMEQCGTAAPPLFDVGPNQQAACYLYHPSAVGGVAGATR